MSNPFHRPRGLYPSKWQAYWANAKILAFSSLAAVGGCFLILLYALLYIALIVGIVALAAYAARLAWDAAA
jgi:hypothetical protein